MTTLNVNHFSYNKTSKVLSAEASVLELFCGQHDLSIKNYKTGNAVEVSFAYQEMDFSGEDIMAFVYEPVSEGAPITKVIIYND